MKIFGVFLLAMALLFQVSVINAHENNDESSKKEGQLMKGDSSSKTNIFESGAKPVKEAPPFKVNYLEEVFSHVHNKLVHFPVALTIVAFFLMLFSLKWKQLELSVKVLVSISALIALPTAIAGLLQSAEFTGDPKEWLVDVHEALAYFSLAAIWIWAVFLFKKPLQKFAWIAGTISFILITITGFLGGIIAQ